MVCAFLPGESVIFKKTSRAYFSSSKCTLPPTIRSTRNRNAANVPFFYLIINSVRIEAELSRSRREVALFAVSM